MKVALKPPLLMPLFLLALVAGILGGWMRMGWAIHVPEAAGYHGLLMTGGFMGGLITMERTITMKNRWWLTFPLSCGLAVLATLAGEAQVGTIFLLIGGSGLILFYLNILNHQKEPYWYVLLGGAVFWLIGNLKFLLTGSIPLAVNWWVGFILLTILGERMELTKFLPIPKAERWILWVLLGLAALGLILPVHGGGKSLYLVAGMGLVVWFVRNDMARKSVKKSGYQRYLGIGILTAHAWLLTHLLALYFLSDSYLGYDIYIHAFFLGFGFSMIWAHAPMLLPAILKFQNKAFHSVLWLVWAIFQLTLLGRVLSSILQFTEWRKYFGMANGIAVLLMFVSMILVMVWRRGKS